MIERPPLLAVENLDLAISGTPILSDVTLSVDKGEVLGLVGESGSGKSMTANAIMRLLPANVAIDSGRILFEGRDLAAIDESEMRKVRGAGIAMIFQEPMTALNPLRSIGDQIGEMFELHTQLSKKEIAARVLELLEEVRIPDPAQAVKAYPHELSGGQRQRVLIAMALSRDPKLIVADEPTTALDVTVQAQVMKLLLRLKEELGFALILVSHDLALVSDIVDRVVVMYGGQVAETGGIAEVVGAPAHHYTRGLLSAVLSLESGDAELTQIKGVVPSPAAFPAGCRFSDRCPAATAICRREDPRLEGTPLLHEVACHHPARRVGQLERKEVPA